MLTARKVKEARALWGNGESIEFICDKVGTTKSSLANYMLRHRDEFPKRRRYRRFTDKERSMAVALVREGMPISEAAKRIGANYTTVWKWAKEL